MNTLLTFVLNIAFGVRFWALMNPEEATLALALIGALFTLEGMILFVVRPGVLSNYALWKREKDAWNQDYTQRVYGDWKPVKGLLRFWRAGLTVRWESLGLDPEFSRRWFDWANWWHARMQLLHSKTVYGTRREGLKGPEKYHEPDWTIGEAQYALTYRPWEQNWRTALRVNWTSLMRVLWGWGRWTLAIFAIVGFLLYPLPWLAGFFTPTAAETSTAVPTSTPLPTATPEPIEVTSEGNALVVELDRDVPPSEFWRRINEALSASCDVCPSIPTIPIPDWVWDIIGDWEFTIIRLPEGLDGYIVAYQTPYGMAVQRVDDNFQAIGNAEPLAETEATIAARDRRFGIGYDKNGWDLPINGYRGGALVTVTESSNLPLIVEARGFAYNFRLWHIAIVIVLIIVGVVAYRRLYY